MKRCTKCGEERPFSEFFSHPEGKNRLRPDCKVCVRSRVKARRASDLQGHRERDRKRYAEDEVRRADVIRRAHEHYEDNRDAHLAYRQAYYQANPEVFERARAKRRASERGAEHQPYSRREIYDRDEGVCKGCGKSLDYKPYGFEIDHIVPVSLGGPDTPANVQLMCQPCNRRKWATLEGQIHLPV